MIQADVSGQTECTIGKLRDVSTFAPFQVGLFDEIWHALSQMVDHRDGFEASINNFDLTGIHQ